MVTDPPQEETFAYWLRRFLELRRRQERDVLQRLTQMGVTQALAERVLRLETDAVLREVLGDWAEQEEEP